MLRVQKYGQSLLSPKCQCATLKWTAWQLGPNHVCTHEMLPRDSRHQRSSSLGINARSCTCVDGQAIDPSSARACSMRIRDDVGAHWPGHRLCLRASSDNLGIGTGFICCCSNQLQYTQHRQLVYQSILTSIVSTDCNVQSVP
jgi:hypothetical protein